MGAGRIQGWAGVMAISLAAVVVHAEEADWAATLVDQLRAARDDADEHAAVLGTVSTALTTRLAKGDPLPKAFELLMSHIEAACKSDVHEVRAAAWRAAAAACSSRGCATLKSALAGTHDAEEMQRRAAAVAVAVRLSRCAGAHMVLLDNLSELWRSAPAGSVARAEVRAALETCARATGTDAISDRPSKRARDALLQSFQRTLEATTDPTLRADVLLALALAPTEPSRRVLTKWFRDPKHYVEGDVLLVIEGLGETGDPAAVPFLLGQVADTKPAVLTAAVVSLHKCSAEAHREHCSALFDVLATGLAKEARFLRAIMDSKRKEREPLIARARGLYAGLGRARSVHALLWKIVDANSDLFEGKRPVPPPRGMIKPAKPGQGNVVTIEDWAAWWKGARKHARRR